MADAPSARILRLLGRDGVTPGARTRGVPNILVCSAREAVSIHAARRGVVIAIRDPGAPIVVLPGGWKAVLHLEIPDVDEFGNLDAGVDLTVAASEVAAFITTHRRVPRLMLHCHLGVSRSRSTAAAICDTFGWPYHFTVLHEPLYRAITVRLKGMP